MQLKCLFSVLLILIAFVSCSVDTNTKNLNEEENMINLLVRADDIGFCHAANVACIDTYRNGIVRSVEVMVPCPWFWEAAEMLRDNPGYDVGVHLTLNGEWDNYRWGTLTAGKTLVDEDHFFYQKRDQFLNANIDLEELENELRAQIEIALKYIPQVSHLSYHMDTVLSKPEFVAIVEKLSAEYNLPMGPENLKGMIDVWAVPADEKEGAFVQKLNELTPGNWMFVCHPALDVPETRALTGKNTEYDADIHMSIHRSVITKLMKSKRIKKLIQERNIRLINYVDTFKEKS